MGLRKISDISNHKSLRTLLCDRAFFFMNSFLFHERLCHKEVCEEKSPRLDLGDLFLACCYWYVVICISFRAHSSQLDSLVLPVGIMLGNILDILEELTLLSL